MKKNLTFLFLCAVFAVSAQTRHVTVEIDFGNEKPAETHQVEWYEGMTAMTALQSCAVIESHPVKTYIFVSSVSGVRTERGARAWYYTVNGESTGRIAFRYQIKAGDTVRWIYKTDVCSGTVDKDKKCAE